VGEREHRGQIQNLVNWEKYDQSFDTWEPRENILDKRLLKSFHKTVDVTVDVHDLLHALREAVVQELMGLEHPEASVEVPVPLAALGPLARAIFEQARRPPSWTRSTPSSSFMDARAAHAGGEVGGAAEGALRADGRGGLTQGAREARPPRAEHRQREAAADGGPSCLMPRLPVVYCCLCRL